MTERAQIVKAYAGYYDLRWQNQTITCRARGNLSVKKGTHYQKNEIYTGDWVEFSLTQANQGVIESVEPRKNFLEDIRVANIDQVLLLLAIKNPDLSFRLLNEYLVLMRSVPDLPLLVGFNKIDLGLEPDIDLDQLQSDLKKINIPSLALSAKTKQNLEALEPYLVNKVTVISGPSGSGKSTLINDFFPNTLQNTQEVSEKIGRGKQTTRFSQLLINPSGISLIDTPGFSSVDLKISKKNWLSFFPELTELPGSCQFRDCLHLKEPRCKVKQAVNDLILPRWRYDYYVETYETLKEF